MGYIFPKYSLLKIGSTIKSRREELDIDLASLSEKLGIKHSRLEKIELGKAALTFSEFNVISSFLDIPFDELTRVEEFTVNEIYCRSNAPSEAAIKTIKKAQEIFIELISQTKLRS